MNASRQNERTKRFLARYYHDGAWWSIDVYAYDFDDAESRCGKLGLQLDGEHVMTIPAVGKSSWLPNLIIRVRNLLTAR